MKRYAIILIFTFLSLSVSALDEIVIKKEFKLDSYETISGKTIKNVRIGYETYGKLNPEKTNVILIAHYFTGNSHAAGKYQDSDKTPGYWDAIIGPGKPFDTNKYFIVSSDTLVNLNPHESTTITTGPATIDPSTKKPYGMRFPLIGVKDFIRVQKSLLDSLGIKKLHAVAGASGGAAQAVNFATAYPDDVSKVIAVIGPGLSLPPYTIALLDIWAAPIKLDPNWKNGDYGNNPPLKGLIESLKLITHSSLSFEWAETLPAGADNSEKSPLHAYENKYAIEAYFNQRATLRATAIDANSLLYMAKAIQSFNVENDIGGLKAEVLFIPVRTDLIFPPELSVKAAKKLCDAGKKASIKVIEGRGGHLDGLSKISEVSRPLTDFLSGKGKHCKF